MKLEAIRKGIDISASKERVWQVLTDEAYTRRWYAEFSEGTYADTDWSLGSKAVFKDSKGSGLVAKIVANKPAELLSMQFQGMVIDGVEDCESDLAKALQAGHETYHLSGDDVSTRLSIECDSDPDSFEMMSASWDKALQRIKRLAESL